PGMVHLTPQNEERHERERANIVALWDRQGPARFMLPLNPPLKNSAKGKNFGSRRVFNNESRSPHSGIDYSARKGTSILSAETGTVALAENHYFAGNSVFIDHGGGLITMYFHLDKILVRHGDTVDRGQAIGTVGSTGRATGPHLHFGIRWNGARVDPAVLLGATNNVPSIP
ncbi:MAG: M23 family metallopeptidase, partial [bacterium]|nr:M23 family metallopeptidase [bacterium]